MFIGPTAANPAAGSGLVVHFHAVSAAANPGSRGAGISVVRQLCRASGATHHRHVAANEDTIGHELVSAVAFRTGNDDTFPHGRVLAETASISPSSHAEAADFQLAIDAAEIPRSRLGRNRARSPGGRVARPARC